MTLAKDEQVCVKQAKRTKEDLILSESVPNKDKSIWGHVQNLVRLGFIWNLKHCLFQSLPENVANLVDLAGVIYDQHHKFEIRSHAKFCDNIISFTMAIVCVFTFLI